MERDRDESEPGGEGSTTTSPALPRLLRVPGGAPNLYAPFETAAQGLKPGEGVRVRLATTVYDTPTQAHQGWPGVSWVVELPPDVGERFVAALDGFIQGWVADEAEARRG